jgi:putative DNA primase/helicase
MAYALNASVVRQAATNRWPSILTALGIPAAVLRNSKNQPCPACGGRDRFQFLDRGKGRFVCRAIEGQGGDGFRLVMHLLNCDFKIALHAVANALGQTQAEAPHSILEVPTKTLTSEEWRRKQISEIWSCARPIQTEDPVARYLEHRGLTFPPQPSTLRCHPALPYWSTNGGTQTQIGSYPAMIAQIITPQGATAGLHRTYLEQSGNKAMPVHPATDTPLPSRKLMACNSIQGAAIRLFDTNRDVIAVAEGIETALAVHLMTGLPCWSALNAWGLEHVVLPREFKRVCIMADHDPNGVGQRAAMALTCRLRAEGREVHLAIPKQAGEDWLDVLINGRQPEIHSALGMLE